MTLRENGNATPAGCLHLRRQTVRLTIPARGRVVCRHRKSRPATAATSSGVCRFGSFCGLGNRTEPVSHNTTISLRDPIKPDTTPPVRTTLVTLIYMYKLSCRLEENNPRVDGTTQNWARMFAEFRLCRERKRVLFTVGAALFRSACETTTRACG